MDYKRAALLTLALWLLVFLMPLISVKDEPLLSGDGSVSVFVPEDEDNVAPTPTSAAGEDDEGSKSKIKDSLVTIKALIGGEATDITLEDYLYGVVASEMPALYPEEALKAQAVAARTYIMFKKAAFEKNPNLYPAHNGAMICDDPSHCAAFSTEAVLAQKWSTKASDYEERIRSAIAATDGEIMTYQGVVFSAVFHAVSSGRTESAADVWGSAYPYLVAVDSKWDEKSPQFFQKKEINPDDFKAAFLKNHSDASFVSDPAYWFKSIKRSASGGVLEAVVGGVTVSGTELRSLCSLASTNFTVGYKSGKLVFETRGYGHGVGMSQYGARCMALDGKSYKDILTWYYTGIEISTVSVGGGEN